MRIGSFCSGYGGLDLAAEWIFSASVVWHAENAAAPARILAAHWPGVPNHGDITQIDWRTVEPIDIATAGYPCQPFALARKRKGTTDERHIWPHIREGIRHLRPRITVLENVPGHRSLGFDRVLGDLAEIGFDAQWTSVRAADVGAPHQRERLFVMAYPADDHRARPQSWIGRPTSADCRGEEQPRWAGLRAREEAPIGRTGLGDSDHAAGFAWHEYEPSIRRWEQQLGRPAPHPLVTGPRGGKVISPRFEEWWMGLPEGWVTAIPGLTDAEQIAAIGNGVVPQQAEAAIRWLLNVSEAVA